MKEKAIWEEAAVEETKLLYAGAAYMSGATKWVLLRRNGEWYTSTPDDGYFTLESEKSVRYSFEKAAEGGLIVSWGTRAHHLASIPICVKSTRKVEVGLGSVFNLGQSKRTLTGYYPKGQMLHFGFLYEDGVMRCNDGWDTAQKAIDYAREVGYKLIEAKGA